MNGHFWNSIRRFRRQFRSRISSKRRRQRARGGLWEAGIEFLEDRALLSISTVSVTAGGTTGDAISNDPHLSRDGRFVAFQSRAEDLPVSASDGNGFQDIFVRNLETDTTTLISVTPAGRSGDDDSWAPTISDNGRFVAFASFATDIGKGTTITSGPNVFVHDRDFDENGVYDEPGGTRVALISHDGVDEMMSGNSASGGITLGSQWQNRPVISGNGAYVTYVSFATNLLDPADGVIVTPGPNLYVSGTAGGSNELVSVDPTGTMSGLLFGGGTADAPSSSFSGRYIAFFSSYVNLVDDDTEGFRDVFVRDILASTTTRASIGVDGKGGDRDSREPVISRNGKHVLFTSRATNFVEGDTNGFEDMFVHNVLTKTTSLVSMSRDPAATSSTANAPSPSTAGPSGGGYAISDTGRYVLFTSSASDLLDPAEGVVDTNLTLDVYAFDRDADGDGFFDEPGPFGTSTSLVSINAAGTDASDSVTSTGGSTAVSLSGDGRYAAFVSPGRNLIPAGTPGTGVYIRDLMTESTALAGLTGLPSALQAGVEEVAITGNPLQVAFSSFALDVDPAVTDANVSVDVFRYDAETDLAFLGAQGDGFDRLVIGIGIRNDDVPAPFEIGVYRSADGEFSAADDELLDTITISGTDLLMGDRKMLVDIGDGPGEVSLPGAGSAETDTDYQILFVLDHLDTVGEFDSDPFNDDNTGRFEGAYHPEGAVGGAPVFIHGRTGSRREDSLEVIEVDAVTLDVFFSGARFTYDPADVTGVRFRGHEGRDKAVGASDPDLLLGGADSDVLRGGDGDDTMGGGPDNDRLFGELGFDTLFDGMGDDLLDLGGTGPDGGVIVSTPGSDDIFIGAGDTIDFSFAESDADGGITLDLDLVGVEQTVDGDLNTILLEDPFLNALGSDDDDVFKAIFDALDREINGRGGDDRVEIDARGESVTSDGTTVTNGLGQRITLRNIEQFFIRNAADRVIDNSDPGTQASAQACTGAIGDFVFTDINANGIQDGPDGRLEGARVLLTDAAGNVMESIVAGGPYTFTGLCAGTYTVDIDPTSIPAGLVPTLSDVGDDVNDSDPLPAVVTLATDDTVDIDLDFGFVASAGCTGVIGDFVFEDVNGNGIQDGPDDRLAGVRVILTDAAGNTMDVVAGAGAYQFTGLCAGDYTVEFDPASVPAGFVPTLVDVGNDAMDSDPSPVAVVLPFDSSVDLRIDFGFVFDDMPACSGEIGDYVWLDTDGDGIQDGDELGIEGALVTLSGPDGDEIVETGPDGEYGFGGLCAGDYEVAVDPMTLPAGLVASPSNVGGDPEIDSNGSPAMVTLATDMDVDLSVDFGFTEAGDACGLSIDVETRLLDKSRHGRHGFCRRGVPVLYKYRLANEGDRLYFVKVFDDQLGFVTFRFRLDSGEERHILRRRCLRETTVNHVFAKGRLRDGTVCRDAAKAIVEVPEDDDHGDDHGHHWRRWHHRD